MEAKRTQDETVILLKIDEIKIRKRQIIRRREKQMEALKKHKELLRYANTYRYCKESIFVLDCLVSHILEFTSSQRTLRVSV